MRYGPPKPRAAPPRLTKEDQLDVNASLTLLQAGPATGRKFRIANRNGVAWADEDGKKYVIDLGTHFAGSDNLGADKRSILDRLIEFQVYERDKFAQEATGTMQVDFNITVRVDFQSDDRYGIVEQAVANAARHLQASVALLNDKVKPEVLVNADDFLKGSKEISLLTDVIQQGVDLVLRDGETAIEEEPVSADLLAAVREMKA